MDKALQQRTKAELVAIWEEEDKEEKKELQPAIGFQTE